MPKGLSGVTLDAMSCVSTTHCVAVGTANGNPTAASAAEVGLIETWNGRTWTLHNVTASGSSAPQASGISCATATFCVLDGTTVTISGTSGWLGTWLESWNGTRLTTMRSAISVLPTAVSRATSSNCAVTGIDLAVSSTTTSSDLTETWDGSSWRLAKVSWPKGDDSFLLGLSCYGAHTCEDVGEDGPSSGTSGDAVAVSLNGTASALQALPAPAKGYSDLLDGVSCLPWGTCVAVGETGKSTAASGSVMTGTWSGKAWQLHAGF